MKLSPITDEKEIYRLVHDTTGKQQKHEPDSTDTIQSFIDQELSCAKVTDFDKYQSVSSASSVLRNAKRRLGVDVSIMVRDGELYIIKKSLKEKLCHGD